MLIVCSSLYSASRALSADLLGPGTFLERTGEVSAEELALACARDCPGFLPRKAFFALCIATSLAASRVKVRPRFPAGSGNPSLSPDGMGRCSSGVPGRETSGVTGSDAIPGVRMPSDAPLVPVQSKP